MLNAFLSVGNFSNGSSETPNPIGHLSNLGYTYSQVINTYSPANTNVDLLVFDSGTLTTPEQAVLTSTCNEIASSLNGVIGYTLGSSTVNNVITTALGANASNITFGALVYNPIDRLYYPEWLEFTYVANSFSWIIKVWLANSDFIANYPLGQITLIYPISNLMDLYDNFVSSKTTVTELNQFSLINLLSSTYPGIVYTGITSLTFRVYEATDTTQYYDLPVLVAFNGGTLYCNPINYLAKFITILLGSSNLTLEQWATVIPTLQPFNKYYVNPNWINVSIPNPAVVSPILSPTIQYNPTIPNAFYTNYFNDYTLTQVFSYLDYTTAVYKSMGLFILPALQNNDGRIRWHLKFPDYFVVPLSDGGIQQMSATTQHIVALLDQAIRFAEIYVEGVTPLPPGTTTEVRGNYVYIVQNVDTTQLAVLTRATAFAFPVSL